MNTLRNFLKIFCKTLDLKFSVGAADPIIPTLNPSLSLYILTSIVHAGGGFGSVKYQIDELNEKTLMYKYSLVEGDALIEGLEKITYEVKFEPSADGGSISKVTSKYYTKGDFVLKEEDVKAGKERVLGMYKVVEDYLLKNPDAYV